MRKLIIRGRDTWGAGHYLARRRKKFKLYKHTGIDIVCVPNESILALEAGTITKIGYPYDPRSETKGHLRYIEVTTGSGLRHRYLYTEALITLGQKVDRGSTLGWSQDLTVLFPDITQHYHYEVLNPRDKGHHNPITLLKELGYECISRSR